jgi:hypothetical protein
MKKALSKARLLSKDNADKLRAEIEAKEKANIAYSIAIKQKKKD